MDMFLTENNIPALLRIPFSRTLATGIAGGRTLVDLQPEYQQLLQDLFHRISTIVSEQTHATINQ